jgi:hypothetical protein
MRIVIKRGFLLGDYKPLSFEHEIEIPDGCSEDERRVLVRREMMRIDRQYFDYIQTSPTFISEFKQEVLKGNVETAVAYVDRQIEKATTELKVAFAEDIEKVKNQNNK